MGNRLRQLGLLHPPIVTVTIIAAVVSTAVRFGVLHHELPLAVAYRSGWSGRALLAGRFHTILSSQLLTRDRFMLVSIVLSLAVMLGIYEALVGSARAALIAIVGAIGAPAVVTLVLGAGSALNIGFAARTLSTLDYGASTITAAGGGALVAALDRKWLTRAAIVFVLGGLVVHHQIADWEHVVAFPTGFALAAVLRSRRSLARLAPPVGWRVAGVLAAAVGVVGGPMGASASVAAPIRRVAQVPDSPGAQLPGAPGSQLDRGVRPASRPLSPLRIVDTHYPTPSTGGERRVLVVVPPGYDSTTYRYPVIEILHGRPGEPQDILTLMELESLMVASPPFVAVVPDGHGPVIRDGDFADTSRQRLASALSEELRGWVDASYRTNGNWGITGLSAGGYGAAYLAARPQGGYRKVCPMSAYFTAVDPPFKGESQAVRLAASPILHVSATGPPTLMIIGDHDAEGLAEGRSYLTAMQKVGQSGQMVILPGTHEWSVWREGLRHCVPFLLQ